MSVYPHYGQPPYRLTPPDELQPDTFAERLYEMLAPLAQQDDQTRWSLLTYVNAVGEMFQLVEDLVRDSAAGPGWSLLLDLERCPDLALPWLAQFVGVRVLPGASSADTRARIASTDGFRRGTRDAMTGAASATLTGLKRLDFRERTGGPLPEPQTYAHVKATHPDYADVLASYPDYAHFGGSPDYAYYVQARTYHSETPDFAATLAALLSQKPGGLVLDYDLVPGQNYAQLKAAYASYAALDAAYPDYLAAKQDEP